MYHKEENSGCGRSNQETNMHLWCEIDATNDLVFGTAIICRKNDKLWVDKVSNKRFIFKRSKLKLTLN